MVVEISVGGDGGLVVVVVVVVGGGGLCMMGGPVPCLPCTALRSAAATSSSFAS